MAKNDFAKPELARASQDVEAVVGREPEGNFHYGRGGAANIGSTAQKELDATHGQVAGGAHAKPAAGIAGVVEDAKEKGRAIIDKIAHKK